MAALTAGRQTLENIGRKKSYPVAAATTIFSGSLVAINAAGNAVPMSNATGLLGVGMARTNAGLDRWDNSAGSAGAISVEVDEGVFRFVNSGTSISTADIGKPCYGVDDQTVALGSLLNTRSPAGRIATVDSGGVFVDLSYELAREVAADSASAIIVSIPCVLAAHSTNSIAARFTPGFAGKIRKITASVTDPATTAAKLGTFTPAIAATPTTGGAVALTSANCTPVGAKIDGSAITALGVFTAAQEITVIATAVTAFVEGQVVLHLFLDSSL